MEKLILLVFIYRGTRSIHSRVNKAAKRVRKVVFRRAATPAVIPTLPRVMELYYTFS